MSHCFEDRYYGDPANGVECVACEPGSYNGLPAQTLVRLWASVVKRWGFQYRV